MRDYPATATRAGWGVVAGRFTLGLLGGFVNALAIFATLIGIVVDAFRRPGEEFLLAAFVHAGNLTFHGLALYLLMTALGDEERSALATIVVWTVTTATALFLYWLWVFG